MTTLTTEEFNKEDEELCTEAQQFCNLYYDILDRKREKVGHLYASSITSNIVWNGNPIEGADNIIKFLSSSPSTRHEIVSLDAQNLPKGLSGELKGGMILKVAGVVNINSDRSRAFTQTLILCVEDERYKIKSDQLRYID